MESLRTGDILLFRPSSLLGRLIRWGQWTGKSQEATEYCHIALIYNEFLAIEMNPPKSRYFNISTINWEYVDRYRLTIPIDFNTFRNIAASRINEKYAYGYVAKWLGLGLLARIGLKDLSAWFLRHSSASHGDACSTWAVEVLEATIRKQKQGFSLLSENGENNIRPADIPKSKYLIKIS